MVIMNWIFIKYIIYRYYFMILWMRGLIIIVFLIIFLIVKDIGILIKLKMLFKYYLENKVNVIKIFFIFEF